MKKKETPEKSGSVIITRQEHGISRKLMSPNALRILYRLKDNGYVAYLVGGCVRDLLLGREPKDFDVVTNATPGEVKRMFRNCRLVGRRFRLAHLHFHEELIEVATFRSQAADEPKPEVEEKRGRENRQRHPQMLMNDDGMILRDNVYGTPEEDALRRDFTVNALAYDIADFSIIDFAGGLADLNAGIIRTIGDPAVRFQEDPVRMLRAVRFAAKLGFTMEEETRKALVSAAGTIVSASRRDSMKRCSRYCSREKRRSAASFSARPVSLRRFSLFSPPGSTPKVRDSPIPVSARCSPVLIPLSSRGARSLRRFSWHFFSVSTSMRRRLTSAPRARRGSRV